MRVSHFVRTFGPLTALATAAAGVVVAPAAHSAGEIHYVSMGDSYSAASGVLPLSSSPWNPECTQSSQNYPHQIAASNQSVALTDVTCGDATTGNFTTNQFGIVAPQANALSQDTDKVSMTIGGNDNNVFLNAIFACGSAGMATLGFGHPCQSIYGDTFVNQINNSTYPNLVNAFNLVKAKAPNANIAVGGYPRILPQSGPGCFLTMPIAAGDIAYVNNIEQTLNSAIQRAAAATGVAYVDIWGPSTGHDSCQPIGTRWVEPAFWGTNYVPVHPNVLGETAYAGLFRTALGL